MIEFKLFRIPVSIHWTFFLLTAFLGGALGAQQPDDWFRVLVFMFAAFHSILIHELGHALTGLKYGAPQAIVQLHGMGGVAVFPQARFSRRKSIIVTAAGPAASILLAILFLVILRLFQDQIDPYTRIGYFLKYFISTMILINIFWSIINLCPVIPLDGGQILQAALGPNRLKSTCIIGFISLGVMAIVLWYFTRSFFNMILILALGNHTWRIWQHIRHQ